MEDFFFLCVEGKNLFSSSVLEVKVIFPPLCQRKKCFFLHCVRGKSYFSSTTLTSFKGREKKKIQSVEGFSVPA
jgi:hypothetical protein